MNPDILAALLLGLIWSAGARPSLASGRVTWSEALRSAAFVKSGAAGMHNPVYQYECLGLGGTTLRVAPHGFTRPPAEGIREAGALEHAPYLAYQYWWDEGGHRHYPFDLTAGYGDEVSIWSTEALHHRLDIRTGLLTMDLRVSVGGPRALPFATRREEFVTPSGVLVVRVTDSKRAGLPFMLRVAGNDHVRLYHQGGIYAGPHPRWLLSSSARNAGALFTATRPASCIAYLAVAVEAARSRIDLKHGLIGADRGVRTITYYIAPCSSYEGAQAAERAWRKADAARRKGFDALRAETAAWWSAFYGRSAVELPDRDVAIWYARSLYYHGVYFGNTDVPPGCNGTGPLFSGAVCPEYDLPFSQLALLYTGHLAEARRVAKWVGRILPRAERYGSEGLTLHKTSLACPGGALVGPLVAWDGTVPVPPTEGEGIWAYERYPGANAAMMALDYVDWSGDKALVPTARRMLKGAAAASVAQMDWRPDLGGYADRTMPNSLQQVATEYLLREAIARGVAKSEWKAMAGRIHEPTALYRGSRVIVVGAGYQPVEGSGDAPWLAALWWYGTLPAGDPLARSTYDMIARSKTGSYVFNNGWMGVYAAKLGLGEEALAWLRKLLLPGVTLHDDTCLGEIVYDAEDFKKTPEIAAHGALLCAVSHMMLDGDSADTLTVFGGLPDAWRRDGVRFAGLRARGGLRVSGEAHSGAAWVTIENLSPATVVRRVRVRLASRWHEMQAARLAPGQKRRIVLP